MNTVKDEVLSLLEDLPEDPSLEDVQYRLYVRQKAVRGFRDADEGRLVSHEDAKQRMSRWLLAI